MRLPLEYLRPDFYSQAFKPSTESLLHHNPKQFLMELGITDDKIDGSMNRVTEIDPWNIGMFNSRLRKNTVITILLLI